MFTQCSKCETVFKLSADVLRAAGGQVRCGRCGEVFNALARLAEDASAFPAGESPLDMETRADQILHSIALPAVGEAATRDDSLDLEAADLEFARLQVVDLELYDDDPAETPPAKPQAPAPTRAAPSRPATPATPAASAAPAAPGANGAAAPGAPAHAPVNRARAAPVAPPTPGTPAAPHRPAAGAAAGSSAAAAPARSPAAPRPPAATRMPAVAPHAPAPAATVADASRSSDAQSDDDAEEVDDEVSMEFTLPPGELDRIFVEPKLRPAVPPLAPAATPAAAAAETTVTAAAVAAEIETPRAPLGLEVPDAVRREMLAGMEDAPLPEILAPRREALPRAVWLGAAIVLALALGAQIVHANRAWLAVHAPLGASLRDIYSMFGFALPAPANLSAYQLRQWGATGEPGAAGTLRVRASILNTAAQLQPYPLLRVTLANRFGSRIGTRDFSPAEYLGKPTVRMLAPGELADATLDIVDPGKDAEGFELDVCLRGADQKVICAADAATPVKQ